eukprot:TRINITY_DN11509_c0_g1_i1.p1 TRINITY_DN11509_c0_g1~~TRINITY_DN11509_c0_g1_i1.p1  ORF type:complete len:144 (+),score=13.58 TRINITY_DN11509_c0_g1_i1:59-433(+)
MKTGPIHGVEVGCTSALMTNQMIHIKSVLRIANIRSGLCHHFGVATLQSLTNSNRLNRSNSSMRVMSNIGEGSSSVADRSTGFLNSLWAWKSECVLSGFLETSKPSLLQHCLTIASNPLVPWET